MGICWGEETAWIDYPAGHRSTGARTMRSEMDPHGISWEVIIGFILSTSFGLWAWVVKKFGEQHIESIKLIGDELKELRKELNCLTGRVQVVEFAQQHFHGTKE